MKNGQLKVWWMSNGKTIIDEEVDNLVDALWILHCQSIIEVKDSSVDWNCGGVTYYNEGYLKPDYDCEDGFVDFCGQYGSDSSELLDMIQETYEDTPWYQITKQQFKDYIISSELKGEFEEIKIF